MVFFFLFFVFLFFFLFFVVFFGLACQRFLVWWRNQLFLVWYCWSMHHFFSVVTYLSGPIQHSVISNTKLTGWPFKFLYFFNVDMAVFAINFLFFLHLLLYFFSFFSFFFSAFFLWNQWYCFTYGLPFSGVVFIKLDQTAAYFFASVGIRCLILYKAFLLASGVNFGLSESLSSSFDFNLFTFFFSRRPCL